MHPFQEFVNPHLGKLLKQLNLDKRFIRGENCYLYDSEGKKYLDFVAGYGSVPFGFNPPDIWQALLEVQNNLEPSFVQPSLLEAAGELAKRLVEVAPEGLCHVTFANSGAEAVEAAIKLCRAATGRLGIISTDNSFHGKTLGALSATGSQSYQKNFGAPVAGFVRVPYGDLPALERVLKENSNDFAAFIMEPIQGEGGIVVPPRGFMAAAKELCQLHGVFFVLDEIQTGLGRTGQLFACQEEGICPDVMLLAKALGGGLLPIAAMLYSEEAYTEEFALKHSSTFAGNTLACRAGLRTLELLTSNRQALVGQVAQNGAFLRQRLSELQCQYPHVLKSVRGRGYMLGLEIDVDMETYGRTSLLSVMATQESLTPLLCSYLLNIEGIRVAPTLNGAKVIRIEPPLIATHQMCQKAIKSIDRMLQHLAIGNLTELIRPLLTIESRLQVLPTPQKRVLPIPTGDRKEGRWAFIVHPVNWQNCVEFDQSLNVLTNSEIKDLVQLCNNLLDPFVISTTRIVADNGKTGYGEFIVVPATAEQLQTMPPAQAVAKIRSAVELARDRGAKIVGLGAYTSVVTRGGLLLKNTEVALTTGNSYTAIAAVDAIYKVCTELDIELSKLTMAVMGATGAIGRATTILLAQKVNRLLLIGNRAHPKPSLSRLQKVAADVCKHLVQQIYAGKSFCPGTIGHVIETFHKAISSDDGQETFLDLVKALEQTGHLTISTEINMLPTADLVVTATSSLEQLVNPQNLKFGAIVCDLSRPQNVSRSIKDARADVLVIDGGIVAVPGLTNLGWNFGFEPGLAYACMAETMILGLSHHYQDTSLGTDLNLPTMLNLRNMGAELGFRLAQLRSFDRPISKTEWTQILQARTRIPNSNRLIADSTREAFDILARQKTVWHPPIPAE